MGWGGGVGVREVREKEKVEGSEKEEEVGRERKRGCCCSSSRPIVFM